MELRWRLPLWFDHIDSYLFDSILLMLCQARLNILPGRGRTTPLSSIDINSEAVL